jgi:hypothetical protein
MPRAGALTLRDLLDAGETHLHVLCQPCGRSGRYGVQRLMAVHGDAALPDLLRLLTKDCDKPDAGGARRCHAVYARLPRSL